MNQYAGDFTPGKTIRLKFNTNKADGTPITLAGTPAVSVYKDSSTTESTAGVTLSVDFDAKTGLHWAIIDTSADGTFYAAGSDFAAVLTAGTVDSISVVGAVVGGFSLANRSALRPTTADRTLDVSAGGEAGLDWANVGSPTTSLVLSGTTVGVSTATGTVNALANGVITAASIAANAITAAKVAADAIGASQIASDAITEIQSGLATAANLATLAGYVDTEVAAIKAKTDALPANPAAVSDIPTAAQNRAEIDSNSTKLAQLAGAFVGSTSVFSTASLVNAPSGGGGGGGVTLSELQDELTTRYLTTANVRAIAAVLVGKNTRAADGSTSSFADINDPATIRVTSVNTATLRTPTVL